MPVLVVLFVPAHVPVPPAVVMKVGRIGERALPGFRDLPKQPAELASLLCSSFSDLEFGCSPTCKYRTRDGVRVNPKGRRAIPNNTYSLTDS